MANLSQGQEKSKGETSKSVTRKGEENKEVIDLNDVVETMEEDMRGKGKQKEEDSPTKETQVDLKKVKLEYKKKMEGGIYIYQGYREVEEAGLVLHTSTKIEQ